MKQKLLLYVVLASLLVISVSAQDLSDYPDMFKRGSNLDVITVVGDKAPATHVLAQTQIALALSSEVNRQVPGLTRLSSEIDRIENINLISIGNACDNPISAEILGNPAPCNNGLSRDIATLELVKSSAGKTHLVLNAYGDAGVKKLAQVLVDYDVFPLSGTSFEISVAEEERSFDQTNDEPEREEEAEEGPKPVVIKEETPPEAPAEKPVVENTNTDGNSQSDDLSGISDDEPEPVLKNEDNIILKLFNWFKGLFS